MSKKSFELNKEDLVVQQFKSGLESWERPFDVPKVAKKIRTRGAVKTIRTRGGIRTRGATKPPDFALPKDDPVVQQFRAGFHDWERPFEKKE